VRGAEALARVHPRAKGAPVARCPRSAALSCCGSGAAMRSGARWSAPGRATARRAADPHPPSRATKGSTLNRRPGRVFWRKFIYGFFAASLF